MCCNDTWGLFIFFILHRFKRYTILEGVLTFYYVLQDTSWWAASITYVVICCYDLVSDRIQVTTERFKTIWDL